MHDIIKYTFDWLGLVLWCLMPLWTIFQLYRDGQFYCWKKPEDPEKTTDLSQVTDTLYPIRLYTSPWSRLELTTSVVIGTDYIGTCKSNYYTITATTDPSIHLTKNTISNATPLSNRPSPVVPPYYIFCIYTTITSKIYYHFQNLVGGDGVSCKTIHGFVQHNDNHNAIFQFDVQLLKFS